jgi:hypothetical protein
MPSPLAQNQTDRILLTVDAISHRSNFQSLQETAQASLPPVVVIPSSFCFLPSLFFDLFVQNYPKNPAIKISQTVANI